jgi:hypothetical protein
MSDIFDDDFLSLLSPLAMAQYRPTPAATFPDSAAPAPGPLSTPPAQPPILLSPPPDPAGTTPTQSASASGSSGPDINNGINNGLANGLNNHALSLMALGAGIAQGGVGRGLADAATAAQAERNLQAQQVNFLQTYKALTAAGVPAEDALAAVVNPSLMRVLAVKYFGPNSLGNASNALLAPANARAMPANGPAVPPTVPNGAAYSPSRRLWKDRVGNLFDQQGRAMN